MKDKTIITVAAIGAITAIEMAALSMGLNGMLLTLSVAAIAGLGGYEINAVKDKLIGKKGGGENAV